MTAPSFGLYQLENLHRQQAKFMMVALSASQTDVPGHRLMNVAIVSDVASASSKIQQKMNAEQYPLWWPVVLISKDGSGDHQVAAALEKLGFVNVFSYQHGWDSLIREAP